MLASGQAAGAAHQGIQFREKLEGHGRVTPTGSQVLLDGEFMNTDRSSVTKAQTLPCMAVQRNSFTNALAQPVHIALERSELAGQRQHRRGLAGPVGAE